jgi:hypothetical protein
LIWFGHQRVIRWCISLPLLRDVQVSFHVSVEESAWLLIKYFTFTPSSCWETRLSYPRFSWMCQRWDTNWVSQCLLSRRRRMSDSTDHHTNKVLSLFYHTYSFSLMVIPIKQTYSIEVQVRHRERVSQTWEEELVR